MPVGMYRTDPTPDGRNFTTVWRYWHGLITPLVPSPARALNCGSGSPAIFVKSRILPSRSGRTTPSRAGKKTAPKRKSHAQQLAQLRAQFEQRVRQRTAQLEAANQELEAFSYTVSHDLRAPLRHIDGFIEILQESAAKQLSRENREYLRVIAQSARQMGILIDDLLAFARLSRTRLVKTRTSLDRLVREAMRHLKREVEGRKVDWLIHDLPDVMADPNLLRQALANLISNALKYTRNCKRVHIEIGAVGNGGEIVVFVRDNGVGFDMRHVDKLFGVFQRLHRASEFEGTGVGLANVRRIIHRHGGRTWAKGTINGGATFYFSLPKKM
jgi:light-regulated signal transduction histidine kinase (bacteriophytochrome)